MPITKKHRKHRHQSKYRKQQQYNKQHNHNKTRKQQQYNKQYNKQYNHNKTRKQNIIILPNNTPKNIDEISNSINQKEEQKQNKNIASYTPTINKELVSFVSAKREPVYNCNNER